jgi:hypothetical protein
VTSAGRTRRWRSRQRAGKGVFRIEIDRASVEDHLIRWNWIRPECADDQGALERALGAMLTQIMTQSPRE